MIDFSLGVTLDTIEEKHLSLMRRARNDFKTWKWCRQSSLVDLRSHLEWFDWQSKDPNTKMFAVNAPNFELVGVCGLTSIDWVSRKAEFSLYICPEYRNRKLSVPALKSLFGHGFQDLGLNVIWGETFDGNPAFDMFLKMGMVHEGTRRDFYYKDGKFLNAHLVSMRADEWKTLPRS